jgi:hypothetical protein
MKARPKQVSDCLGRISCDSGFEIPEKIGDGFSLLASLNPTDPIDLYAKSTLGEVGAEDVKNGCTSQHRQLRPDGEIGLFHSQQAAWPRIRPAPGNIAAKVKSQAASKSGPSPDQELD